jgi:hypothetical protein
LAVVEGESVGDFAPRETERFAGEFVQDGEGAVGGGSVVGFAFGSFDRRGSVDVASCAVGVCEEAAVGVSV